MVALVYLQSFARPNTCFLLPDGSTLKCRIGKGRDEVIVEIPLRFEKTERQARRIRPLSSDQDVWVIEPTGLSEGPASMQLRIDDVPGVIAGKLRKL